MADIRHMVLDVDGTLTDGKVCYSSGGEELKAFNIKDGLALAALSRLGVHIIVMTGRKSEIVERRMRELGVEEVLQGIGAKKEYLKSYMDSHHILPQEVCYIGDDINDLGAMRLCGFKGCPADASPEIKREADFVSRYNGGSGAVREICEVIAKKENLWDRILALYE